MTKWVTVAELATELGISERGVRKQIAEGKWTAKKRGTHWLIQTDGSSGDGSAIIYELRSELEKLQAVLMEKDTHTTDLRTQLNQQTEQINHLKQLLAEKDSLNGQLQDNQARLQQTLDEVLASRREADERSDTIIMTLTQQVQEQQLLIKDLRHRPTSLWQKLKQRLQGTPQTQEIS